MFKSAKELFKVIDRDLQPIQKYLENLNNKIDVKLKDPEEKVTLEPPKPEVQIEEKPSIVAAAMPQIKETAEVAKSKLKEAGKFAAETGSKTYQATKNSLGRLKDKLFK